MRTNEKVIIAGLGVAGLAMSVLAAICPDINFLVSVLLWIVLTLLFGGLGLGGWYINRFHAEIASALLVISVIIAGPSAGYLGVFFAEAGHWLLAIASLAIMLASVHSLALLAHELDGPKVPDGT